MLNKVIKRKLGRFELSELFYKDCHSVKADSIQFDDFISHLNKLKTVYDEDHYWDITCELESDWDTPDWINVYGKRYETDKETSTREKKEEEKRNQEEDKKVSRIKELEAELKKLRG